MSTHSVYECSRHEQKSLKEVERHSGLLHHLPSAEDDNTVDDRSKAGQSSANERTNAKCAPSSTLKSGDYQDRDGDRGKSYNLPHHQHHPIRNSLVVSTDHDPVREF